MTLKELFVVYKTKTMQQKKIIVCHWQTQEGFEINDVDEFEAILYEFGEDEVYLLNEAETPEMYFFEYFIMRKVEPYVVALKHPLMTNAYWSELPDKLIDSFVSEESGVYRYLKVCYKKGIVDYVIEFPPNIDENIMKFCSNKMKKGFLNAKNNRINSNISLLFTNSSRFIDLNVNNFVTYELESLYLDWSVKNITCLNLSRKFWNDIKKVGQENATKL
jgi:hypothetical protein